MSPNRLSVTITSNRPGSLTMYRHGGVDVRRSRARRPSSAATSWRRASTGSPACTSTLVLCTRVSLPLPRAAQARRVRGCSARRRRGCSATPRSPISIERALVDNAARAGVQALGVLPHDDEVEARARRLAAGRRRRAAWTGRRLTYRSSSTRSRSSRPALEHARRHRRAADRAEQDRVGGRAVRPAVRRAAPRRCAGSAGRRAGSAASRSRSRAACRRLRRRRSAPTAVTSGPMPSPGRWAIVVTYVRRHRIRRPLRRPVGTSSQLIIWRSGRPVRSIRLVLASLRSRSKFGRPSSSSAIHSRANSPDWMSARILSMAARAARRSPAARGSGRRTRRCR